MSSNMVIIYLNVTHCGSLQDVLIIFDKNNKTSLTHPGPPFFSQFAEWQLLTLPPEKKNREPWLFILNGNSEHVARALRGIFGAKK